MAHIHLRTVAATAAAFVVGTLFVGCASAPVATGAVGPPWHGETFLPNYGELTPRPAKNGTDYVYIAPNWNQIADKYKGGLLVDQPEVFISPTSPYTGAKPADLESIAEFTREHFEKELAAHGFKTVKEKAPGVIYVRLALTDVELQKKSRNILAYTPVGFVISTGVRAMQDFLEKMDINKFALQAEFLDSESGQQLAAGVISRGGTGTKMSYSEFEALIDEYSLRSACRLYNGGRPQAQQIDCLDDAALKGSWKN